MSHLIHFLRRILRIPRWIFWRLRIWVFPVPLMIRLRWNNRHHHTPLTSSDGPVVSMTTYGPRISTVYLALESIARGSTLPSRLILWIDDRILFDRLPSSICRLQRRGLEVRLSDNYGPHTKYYPYVLSETIFKDALVISDDDQLYPRWWLARLIEAYRKFPHDINCHWAATVVLSGGISEYQSWKRNGGVESTFRQVAFGTSGVIYPPKFLAILKQTGNAFRAYCPKADDLWLHVQALRSGYKIRQISAKRLYNLQIPGSQSLALATENDNGGNDRQIAATYSTEDIQIMNQ